LEAANIDAAGIRSASAWRDGNTLNPHNESRKPVLLVVAPYFPPAYYGGVVQVYLGLLERLVGYEVVVVSDRHGCDVERIEAFDAKACQTFGFHVERIDSFDFHLRTRGSLSLIERVLLPILRMMELAVFFRDGRRQWKELLECHRPDIILCGGTYSAGWLMGCNPAGTRLVNYLHGEELTMKVAPALLLPVMRHWQMRAIRSADLNIAVSRYTAQLVQSLARVDEAHVTLLPNFVDTNRFKISGNRQRTRVQCGWNDRLIILTLARLEPRKGIDQALRALAMLSSKGSLPQGWAYIIAGRGKEESSLRALSEELGITKHVEFLGFVKDEDVPELYEASDMFLQPNREIDGDTEGFGIVFLEASACGIPVIGGVAGGTADAIAEGTSGYRVDGESVVQVAAAVERLANDPALRRRLGEQGAAMVVERFSVQQASIQFSAMLASVIEGRELPNRAAPYLAGDRG
jgi:phosphatidylinositol alpha-1,6-mannosyltransferase